MITQPIPWEDPVYTVSQPLPHEVEEMRDLPKLKCQHGVWQSQSCDACGMYGRDWCITCWKETEGTGNCDLCHHPRFKGWVTKKMRLKAFERRS